MRKRKALIATLPKSGTWYCHTFFWCYDRLLKQGWDYFDGRMRPDLARALAEKKISNVSRHPKTLGIDELFICHTICPGFEESDDAAMQAWKVLHFPLPNNWGQAYLQKRDAWEKLDPALNPDARIIYVFRNPLDHFVSYWDHAQTHVDDSHRHKTLPDGSRVAITGLHDFVFEFGMLGAFIKHYYSFRQMQRKFPRQIRMVPYERLMRAPDEAFSDMLSFLGTPPTGILKERLFANALAMCSKDSLKEIESKIGRALAGDQVNGGRHIRDGSIGKWQKYFSREELGMIESALGAFDISLKEFTLTQDNEPGLLSWIDEITPETRERHRKEFFLQAGANSLARTPDLRPASAGLGKLLGRMARLLSAPAHEDVRDKAEA